MTTRMCDIKATINALDKLCDKLEAHTVKDNVSNLHNVLQTHTEMLAAVAQINATIKNLRKHRKTLQAQLNKTESEFNRMFCMTMQQLDLVVLQKQADKT